MVLRDAVLFDTMMKILDRVGYVMKTDFDNLRKWRRAQVTLAIVVIVLGVIGLVELSLGRICCWAQNVVSLSFVAVSFCVYRCSRCPYCGKSVLSGWSGKDGAGRNCIKRIEKRLPVICVHCGEEVDT